MTTEEKARAYDKAFEKIKYVMEHGVSPTLNKEDLQDIFPELQESEDERIRKELIKYLKEGVEGYIPAGDSSDYQRWLTWIEKQGERKPKWTEEDSSMQLMLMRDIEQVSFISKEGKDERIMWLNKLDDRFHQNTNDIQKSKWTEEDEENFNSIDIVLFEDKNMPKEKYWKIINWFRSFKQRMGGQQ